MNQLTLGDILKRDVLAVPRERLIRDVVGLLIENDKSSAVVMAGDNPVGIFTLRDAVMLAATWSDIASHSIGSYISSPLVCQSDVSMSLDEAYQFMASQCIRNLVIIDKKGALLGIATEREFATHLNFTHFSQIECVESAMDHIVVCAQSDEKISTVIQKMAARRVSYIVVGSSDKPAGILTEQDVARLLISDVNIFNSSVGEVSRLPEHSIGMGSPLVRARDLMMSFDLTHLNVVDEDSEWIGVLSQTVMLGGLAKERSHRIVKHENHFHRLYQEFPLPCQSLDEEGRLIEINAAWEQVLGYKREEVLGSLISDYHAPGQDEKVKTTLQKFIKYGSVKSVEYIFRCHDGSHKTMVIYGHIIRDQQNQFLRTHCILNDITNQREAEVELRKSETRYRTLVEQIPALVYSAELDEYSTTHYMSPQSSEIIGYTQKDLEQNPRIWDQALHPEDRRHVLEKVCECHRNESQLSIDYRMIAKDGRTVWLRDQAKVVVSDEGRYFQGVILDVTAQKEAEYALRMSEQRFRSIFDHAAAGMAMGTPDGCITEVNAAFSKMLGYSRDEMVGMTIKEVTHPDDWEANNIKIEAVRRGNISAYNIEKRYLKQSGDPVWCLLSATWVRDEKGIPLHFIALTQNIDEKKKAESLLQERLNEWTSLINTAPIGIGLVIDRVIQWVSPRFLEMLNYTESEIIGKNSRCVYPDDDEYERVRREKYSQIESTNSGEIETRLMRKDGSVIDVLLRSTVLDPNDMAAGVIFTALDISERKQNERALRLYRTLSDQAQDALFLVDVDTASFVDFNQEACRSLGYDREELLQLQVQDITDMFDVNALDWSDFLKMFSKNGDLTLEAIHRRKDGTKYPVEINATYLTHQEHGYIVGVARDITDRKHVEQALRRKTIELEVLLNSIPSPVYLKDSHSRYQAVNKAFLELIGRSEHQVIGKNDRDIFPEEFAKRCIDSDQKIIQESLAFHSSEDEVANHEGKAHWFSTTKKPLFDIEGRVEGLVGISFDITENKFNLERKLAEEQALRETLILEIHHRIKNHLQGVIGLLRNLSTSSGTGKHNLDMAITQIRTIATVYGLQSSKSGEQILISELVKACVDLHQNTSLNQLILNIRKSTSAHILREESVPIALVINELLTNALKHTPADGGPIQVEFSCDDSSSKLLIRNRSVGLPDDLDFNAGTGLGTGLGLLHTLLPHHGAQLSLYEAGETVIAELKLESPVLYRNIDNLS